MFESVLSCFQLESWRGFSVPCGSQGTHGRSTSLPTRDVGHVRALSVPHWLGPWLTWQGSVVRDGGSATLNGGKRQGKARAGIEGDANRARRREVVSCMVRDSNTCCCTPRFFLGMLRGVPTKKLRVVVWLHLHLLRPNCKIPEEPIKSGHTTQTNNFASVGQSKTIEYVTKYYLHCEGKQLQRHEHIRAYNTGLCQKKKKLLAQSGTLSFLYNIYLQPDLILIKDVHHNQLLGRYDFQVPNKYMQVSADLLIT